MIKGQIQYGTTIIEYSLEFADRKTLGIKVHPNKKIQVIAPVNSSLAKIEKKLRSKASWILKQQDIFLSFHPLTPARRYVSGETHLYLGKQYRLKLIESEKDSVKLQGGNIEIKTKSKADNKHIENQLKKWYKSKAEIHFNSLFEESIPLSNEFYNGAPTLKYRWMKKRWGSCDKKGCVHLNLELIKASKKSIEYVIIHELCHLTHLNHSKAFYELLEKIHPDWKVTKDRLEKLLV